MQMAAEPEDFATDTHNAYFQAYYSQLIVLLGWTLITVGLAGLALAMLLVAGFLITMQYYGDATGFLILAVILGTVAVMTAWQMIVALENWAMTRQGWRQLDFPTVFLVDRVDEEAAKLFGESIEQDFGDEA
jgi:hypothetical protein